MNLIDGRVEIVAEGPHEQLVKLIRWCHKGPPAASVDRVEIEWQAGSGEFNCFQMKY
jgi:acylphosphatase